MEQSNNHRHILIAYNYEIYNYSIKIYFWQMLNYCDLLCNLMYTFLPISGT